MIAIENSQLMSKIGHTNINMILDDGKFLIIILSLFLYIYFLHNGNQHELVLKNIIKSQEMN